MKLDFKKKSISPCFCSHEAPFILCHFWAWSWILFLLVSKELSYVKNINNKYFTFNVLVFFFLLYFWFFFFLEMKIKDWNFKTDHLSELLLLLPHHNIFIYYYYYFGCTTGGMWVFGPAQESNLHPLPWEGRVWTPGSPGKSPYHNINTLLSGNVL